MRFVPIILLVGVFSCHSAALQISAVSQNNSASQNSSSLRLATNVSDMTSDFYQGDEIKFQQAIQLKKDEVFIDQMAYDASTRLFQVNVSFPIFDLSKQNNNRGGDFGN